MKAERKHKLDGATMCFFKVVQIGSLRQHRIS